MPYTHLTPAVAEGPDPKPEENDMSYGHNPIAAATMKRLMADHAAAKMADLRETYKFERSEARACGSEFPSFEEWNGTVTARELAEERAGDDE